MGKLFLIPGWAVWVVCGLWGFFISLDIVVQELGFIGGVIAFAIAPVALTFAPFFEGLAHQNWFPFFIIYGGGLVGMIFIGIGSAIEERK